jgi:hypothetical protein
MSRPHLGGRALEEELEGEDMGAFHTRLERIGRHWSHIPAVPEAHRGKVRTCPIICLFFAAGSLMSE